MKLTTGLENFKSVVSDDLSFASVEIDKNCKIITGLYPGEEICVTAFHVTTRHQGLSSNDQGRQRREALGTRLEYLWNKERHHKKTPFYSTLKSLLNERILGTTYFSGHMLFKRVFLVKSLSSD